MDLVVILQPNQTDGARKKLIRDIHKTAAGDLPEVEVLGSTSKKGHNRLVHHQYQQLFIDPAPVTTEHILLEITAFGEPEPHSPRPLLTYVGQQLLDQGQADIVQEYGLAAFDFNVLSLERTFAEKIMALVRSSYEEDPAAETGRKVRHLYDLHQLASQPEVMNLLAGPGLFQQLAAVQHDDAAAGVIGPTREWKTKPLSSCWAYADEAANLQQLQQPYEEDLPRLVHGTLPPFAQVLHSMQAIASLLCVYDEQQAGATQPEPQL